MNNLKGFIVAFALTLLLFQSVAKAQEEVIRPELSSVKVLSLSECFNAALESSYGVLSAKEDIEISRAKVSEARSGYMPRIKTRVSYSYFNTNDVIRTPLSDSLLDTLAGNAVYDALGQRAMVSGFNPISRSAITDFDVLANLARMNGTDSKTYFDQIKNQTLDKMKEDGQNILRTPIHGTSLFNTEISFQQPVFLWGKVYNKHKEAKAGVNVSQSDLKITKNDILYQVYEDYQKILLAKDGLKLARDTEIQFKTLKDIVKGMYNGGAENVTKLDYLEVEAYLGLIRKKLYETEKNLDLAKASLRNTLGMDNSIMLDIEGDEQVYQLDDYNMDDSIRKALINRPEFSKLDYGIAAKQCDIKSTSAENKPKLLLDSAFNVTTDNKSYLEPDPVRFRFSVIAEIPLFDGFITRSRVNQKRHELEKLKIKEDQLKTGVTLQVIEAILSLEEAQKTLKATEEAEKSAIENRQLARESFELEIVESKKVVDAQVLEAKIKTQKLLAIFDYNVAKARLKKVMGESDSISNMNFFEIMDNEMFLTPDRQNDIMLEKPETIL